MDCWCYRGTNSHFTFSNKGRDSHPKRHISGVGGGGIMPTPQTMDLQVRRSYMAVSMVETTVSLEQSLFS